MNYKSSPLPPNGNLQHYQPQVSAHLNGWIPSDWYLPSPSQCARSHWSVGTSWAPQGCGCGCFWSPQNRFWINRLFLGSIHSIQNINYITHLHSWFSRIMDYGIVLHLPSIHYTLWIYQDYVFLSGEWCTSWCTRKLKRRRQGFPWSWATHGDNIWKTMIQNDTKCQFFGFLWICDLQWPVKRSDVALNLNGGQQEAKGIKRVCLVSSDYESLSFTIPLRQNMAWWNTPIYRVRWIPFIPHLAWWFSHWPSFPLTMHGFSHWNAYLRANYKEFPATFDVWLAMAGPGS